MDAAVKTPAEEGQEDSDEGAGNIRRNGIELLSDGAGGGVDGLDNCGCEEGEALNSDIIEEEYKGCGEGDGAEDAAQDFWCVDFV